MSEPNIGTRIEAVYGNIRIDSAHGAGKVRLVVGAPSKGSQAATLDPDDREELIRALGGTVDEQDDA